MKTMRQAAWLLFLLLATAASAQTGHTGPPGKGPASVSVSILRPLTQGQLKRIIELNRSSGRDALIRPEIAKAFAMTKDGDELSARQLVIDMDIGVKNAFIEPETDDGSYLFSTFRAPNFEGDHLVFRVGHDLKLIAAIRLDKDQDPRFLASGDAKKMLQVVFDEWVRTLDLLDLDKNP